MDREHVQRHSSTHNGCFSAASQRYGIVASEQFTTSLLHVQQVLLSSIAKVDGMVSLHPVPASSSTSRRSRSALAHHLGRTKVSSELTVELAQALSGLWLPIAGSRPFQSCQDSEMMRWGAASIAKLASANPARHPTQVRASTALTTAKRLACLLGWPRVGVCRAHAITTTP
jgi:hypothetical protein